MHLNKVRYLILILSIFFVIACSSNKHSETDQISISSNRTRLGKIRENLSSEFFKTEQIQKLQQENIIYFDYDKYDISTESISILNKHADFLRSYPATKIVIEGHADERGTPEYNISLGERRANEVSMYLQGRGVSNQKILIVSYGKLKPAEIGHDENSYAKNRRVILVY